MLPNAIAQNSIEKLPKNINGNWKNIAKKFDTLIYVNEKIAVFGVDKKVKLNNSQVF